MYISPFHWRKDYVRLRVSIPSPWHFSYLSCHSRPLLKSLPGRPHCRKHHDTSFDILQSTTFPFTYLSSSSYTFPFFCTNFRCFLNHWWAFFLSLIGETFATDESTPLMPVWSGIFSSSITFKFPCQTWPTFLRSIIKRGHKV